LDGSEHLALVVGSSSSSTSSSSGAAATPVCVHNEQHGVDLLTGVPATLSNVAGAVEGELSRNGNGSSSSGSSNGMQQEGPSSSGASSSGSGSLDGALHAVASQGGGVVLYMRSGSGELQDVEGRSSSASGASSSTILEQCRALHQQQQQQQQGSSSSSFDLKTYGLASQVRGSGRGHQAQGCGLHESVLILAELNLTAASPQAQVK